MKAYRDTAIPAASRTVNLVRLHHSAQVNTEEAMTPPASEEKASLARNWKREARANHLRAKRRTVLLPEIPKTRLPVILEISGGSNFVILREVEKDGKCLVQFPDARESIVDRERLEEVYDGTCVFLNPEDEPDREGGSREGGFRKMLFLLRPTRGTAKSFFFSLAILAGALFYVQAEAPVHEVAVGRSLALPLMGILAAGCALLGMVQLRLGWLGKDAPSRWSELAFVPHFLVTALVLSGPAVWAQLIFALVPVGYLLFSSRLGSVSSRLEKNRNVLTGISFLLGVLGTAPLVLSGHLGPEMMAASVSLASYSAWLIARCDRTCQAMRLAAGC